MAPKENRHPADAPKFSSNHRRHREQSGMAGADSSNVPPESQQDPILYNQNMQLGFYQFLKKDWGLGTLEPVSEDYINRLKKMQEQGGISERHQRQSADSSDQTATKPTVPWSTDSQPPTRSATFQPINKTFVSHDSGMEERPHTTQFTYASEEVEDLSDAPDPETIEQPDIKDKSPNAETFQYKYERDLARRRSNTENSAFYKKNIAALQEKKESGQINNYELAALDGFKKIYDQMKARDKQRFGDTRGSANRNRSSKESKGSSQQLGQIYESLEDQQMVYPSQDEEGIQPTIPPEFQPQVPTDDQPLPASHFPQYSSYPSSTLPQGYGYVHQTPQFPHQTTTRSAALQPGTQFTYVTSDYSLGLVNQEPSHPIVPPDINSYQYTEVDPQSDNSRTYNPSTTDPTQPQYHQYGG